MRINVALAFAVALGCQPKVEREDQAARARYFSGAEWVVDGDGRVVRTNAVMFDRDAPRPNARVVGLTSKNGVLRVIELHPSSDGGPPEKHVLELTPLPSPP